MRSKNYLLGLFITMPLPCGYFRGFPPFIVIDILSNLMVLRKRSPAESIKYSNSLSLAIDSLEILKSYNFKLPILPKDTIFCWLHQISSGLCKARDKHRLSIKTNPCLALPRSIFSYHNQLLVLPLRILLLRFLGWFSLEIRSINNLNYFRQ